MCNIVFSRPQPRANRLGHNRCSSGTAASAAITGGVQCRLVALSTNKRFTKAQKIQAMRHLSSVEQTQRQFVSTMEDAKAMLKFNLPLEGIRSSVIAADNPLCSPDYRSQPMPTKENRTDGSIEPPAESPVCSRWARDTFLVYRIIGNDLPPRKKLLFIIAVAYRHHANQTINNLRFVLEHEPDLQDCEKWWVINRVVDQSKVTAVVALLEEYQQNFIIIPFEEDSFKKVDFIFNRGVVPQYYSLYKKSMMQKYVIQDIYHTKNLYVMNNNGARNACVKHGRIRAKWILPLDGNIFINEKAWSVLLDSVDKIHGCQIKYVMMPMARVLNNDVVLRDGFNPTEAVEEPQVMFRCDAREEFDSGMRYGRRPKVDLFFRLNYPGVWDAYKTDSYSILSNEPNKTLSVDTGEYLTAGYVLRLAAGTSKKLETTGEGGKKSARHIARLDGITNFIDSIDEKILSRVVDGDTMMAYPDELLQAMALPPEMAQGNLDMMPETPEQWAAQKLIKRANDAIRLLPPKGFSVVDKTAKAPSGSKHDYNSLSPLFFPNPTKENGVPYEPLVEGQHAPAWVYADMASEKYDATRMRHMINNVTLLALAYRVSGGVNETYSNVAGDLIRTWFLNPDTRMNPHLEYSHMINTGDLLPKFQGLLGGNVVKRYVRGLYTGISDGYGFHYFLDAVRILRQAGEFNREELQELHAWFKEYYYWLQNGLPNGPFPGFDHPSWVYPGYGSAGSTGQEAQRAPDYHGIWFDVQIAAIGAFLNEFSTNSGVNQRTWDAFLHTVHMSRLRLMQTDRQIYDPADEDYCHYLHGWEAIARMARIADLKIWRGEAADGAGPNREFKALFEQARAAISHLRYDAEGRWLGPLDPAFEEDLLRGGSALLGCSPPMHWELISGPPSIKAKKAKARHSTETRESVCADIGEWDSTRLPERKAKLIECLKKNPTNGFISFSQHSGFTNQSLMAYGSCKTEVLASTYLIHQSLIYIKAELIDKNRYQPLSEVVDFYRVSPKYVTLVDHRDFHELLWPTISSGKPLAENMSYIGIGDVHDVDYDCMDNQWVYDQSDLEGATKEVKLAKYVHTNITWESQVIYRDVVKALSPQKETLLRLGSMFGNDFLNPSAQAMKKNDIMRKTQVLFFSDPIVQAAKSIREQLGGTYASWHLRLGDTFVRDAQRRAAEKNQTITMEQIARQVSDQVESELPLSTTLFIATDLGSQQRPKLIGHIMEKYRVFFLDDFPEDLMTLAAQIKSPAAYLDQMVAVCASLDFFGTEGSSFSAQIRNLRRNAACD